MELEEKAEEVLETLWSVITEEKRDHISPEDLGVGEKESAVEQLLSGGYITLSQGQVRLTEKGLEEAAGVVRRHRLAERLLVDVLQTRDFLIHEKACKFEHLLDRGLDENICSLLGHPKVCPHGKKIPPGSCCLEAQVGAEKVVSPLSQLSPGERGKIAYIYAPQATKLQKLMAMGLLPGTPISLLQAFPSYVLQIGHTQFAVDREIAEAIYVRLSGGAAGGRGRRRRAGIGRRLALWQRRNREAK